MKKISLKNLNLQEVEQLSREQLKNVLGGFSGSGYGDDYDGTGSGGNTCGVNYYRHDGTREDFSRGLSLKEAKEEAAKWNTIHYGQDCYISNGCKAIAKYCCDSCD